MSGMRVYAIGHPDGYVKIGQSAKPLERLSGLQTGSPYELWLISTITPIEDGSDLVFSVESGLHQYFEPAWSAGEWFDIPDDEIHAFGNLREIRASNLEHVLHEQDGRVYTDDPMDPYLTVGERNQTLVDYLKVARNQRVAP